MKYRYIFKKDLPKWLAKGWEFRGDIKQFITGSVMKKYLNFEECLIRKGSYEKN